MEGGQSGVNGANAQYPVEGGVKCDLVTVTSLHLPMVVQIVRIL